MIITTAVRGKSIGKTVIKSRNPDILLKPESNSRSSQLYTPCQRRIPESTVTLRLPELSSSRTASGRCLEAKLDDIMKFMRDTTKLKTGTNNTTSHSDNIDSCFSESGAAASTAARITKQLLVCLKLNQGKHHTNERRHRANSDFIQTNSDFTPSCKTWELWRILFSKNTNYYTFYMALHMEFPSEKYLKCIAATVKLIPIACIWTSSQKS